MVIVKAGTEIKVKHIVGETVQEVAKKLYNGNYLFLKDSYVQGEPCKGGFFHIRQAREVLPKKKLGNNEKVWPRLRKACHVVGAKSINIPGGDSPIHYTDEIVVPDFSVNGSHYFVIPKKLIGELLKCVPLDEKAQEKQKKMYEAQEYQKNSPKAISQNLGNYFWHKVKHTYHLFPKEYEYEFIKISFHDWEGNKKSISFSNWTDLIWFDCVNVSKIDTGLGFYLDGRKAGCINPEKYNRLKTHYSSGWSRHIAYMLPDSNGTDFVADSYRWLSVFDSDRYEDRINKEYIVSSKHITFEFFSLDDKLVKRLEFYTPETKEAI